MNILPLLSQRRKSGAYKMIIWFIFFFIVSQIIIEKGQLPTVVYQFGLVKTLVFTAVCTYKSRPIAICYPEVQNFPNLFGKKWRVRNADGYDSCCECVL